jgi:hypothetical protein
MPRVSSAPEDAYHFKGTFEEGWGKVTAAECIVYQFPPQKEDSKDGSRQAGHQDPPQLMVRLEIQRYLDGDGNKSGAPPEEVLLSVQKPSKDSGLLDQVHCGNYPDGNVEADPEDASGDLGATGNTFYAVADGYRMNDKCKWMKFTTALEEKGFKPAILKRSYFGDLLGLYAFFKNVQQKGSQAGFDANYFVVDRIAEFPYEKKGGAGAAAAKSPAKTASAKPAASKANGAAAPSAAYAPSTGDTTTAEEIAQAIIAETFPKKNKGILFKTPESLKVAALFAINDHRPAVPNDIKRAVQDTIKSKWLMDFGEAIGAWEVQADGQIQVAQ